MFDMMELEQAAPAFSSYRHDKFAIVEIIPEAYKEHLAFIAGLNVEGYQEPTGVIFFYDGMEWPQPDGKRSGPLQIGEQIIMPLKVAEHGLKATRVWHHQDVRDAEGNVVGRKPNYRTAGKPMLRIALGADGKPQILDPGTIEDMVKRAARVNSTPALCPWCSPPAEIPQADFKEHVQRAHFGGLTGEAKPESISEQALRLANDSEN